MGWVVFYYTEEPGEMNPDPKVFRDLQLLLEELNKCARNKLLHAVYKIGECVGDFS